MKTLISLAAGLGGGAGLMYFLDSGRGRRRGLVRDTVTHLAPIGATAAGKTWRDVSHRGRGFVSTMSRRVRHDAAGADVLAARVRAALGRVVSHPRALAVTIGDGQVTLRGPILAREVDRLLARVARVRGVTAVDNQLEIHEEAGQVSSLQGGEPRTGTMPGSTPVQGLPGGTAMTAPTAIPSRGCRCRTCAGS